MISRLAYDDLMVTVATSVATLDRVAATLERMEELLKELADIQRAEYRRGGLA